MSVDADIVKARQLWLIEEVVEDMKLRRAMSRMKQKSPYE